MAISIQIVEKNKNIQAIINSGNSDIYKQIVTHHHNDEVVALNYATQQQPKMILLNYEITGSGSFDYISFLLNKSPASKIIVIGNDLSQKQILSCLLAGANGYLEQKSLETFLNKAIVSVLNNEVWISRKMTALLLEQLRNM